MATNKPELVICRGLQASGKTTWAHKWVAEDRANRVRVNRDELRQMVDNGVYVEKVTEGRILALRNAAITEALMRGLSVVSDDTNLSSRNVRDLAKIAHLRGYPWRVQDFTDVSLEECIRRNQHRNAYQECCPTEILADQVIRDTYNRYLAGRKLPLPVPTPDQLGTMIDQIYQPYLPPLDKPDAIIIDVDGTVALRGTRDPFDETRVNEDKPNQPVIDVIRLDIAYGRWPIFVSGRTDKCYTATWAWLNRHVTPEFDLHMREAGDGRMDAIVKSEIFDKYIRDNFNVRRVYDDRNQVVQMWRSLGLTVFQVADGNF